MLHHDLGVCSFFILNQKPCAGYKVKLTWPCRMSFGSSPKATTGDKKRKNKVVAVVCADQKKTIRVSLKGPQTQTDFIECCWDWGLLKRDRTCLLTCFLLQVNNIQMRIQLSSSISRLVALRWSGRSKTRLGDAWHAKSLVRIPHYALVREKAPNKLLRKYGKWCFARCTDSSARWVPYDLQIEKGFIKGV